jgi:hypothetical protein
MFNCFNVRHSLLDSTLREDQELLGHTKSKKCQDAWVWLVVRHAEYDKRVNRFGETGVVCWRVLVGVSCGVMFDVVVVV